MSRIVIGVVALFILVSSASAQIIYEPVEYQYRTCSGVTYYYGGSDPAIHAIGGIKLDGHRDVTTPYRVYTDATGFIDARLLGYYISDARQEAYENQPRYFTKRDLLASAVHKDGAWVVPATAPTVHVYKSDGTRLDHGPATEPKPLLIIPRDMLEKPAAPRPQSDNRQLVMK
jgi:hypothetical protein